MGKPKILQMWHFVKIIRFERKTRRWNRLAPKNSISLTDWKNFKDCGFYGHIGKKKFFASTLLSIKSAIFKIFPIRQKYWILWGRPVPTPCFALKSDDFWQNATFLADFWFLAQKGPPKKKIQQKRLAIPYEFWLPFKWIQPFVSRTPTHMRKGGAPEPLHCIPSIGVYIYTYIYI